MPTTKKFLTLDKLSHFLLKIREILPTKTSDLTNDSNFITDANYVHTESNFTNDEKTKLSYIDEHANNYTLPVATANTLGGVKIGSGLKVVDEILQTDLPENEVSWSDIESKPTNIAGFGITDAYTKTEIDGFVNVRPTQETVQNLINTAIGTVSSISYLVVQTLPESGAGATIYLVPKTGAQSDIYDEYIWVNDTYEKIGTTDVDLSNYWSTSNLVEITNAEIDALFV